MRGAINDRLRDLCAGSDEIERLSLSPTFHTLLRLLEKTHPAPIKRVRKGADSGNLRFFEWAQKEKQNGLQTTRERQVAYITAGFRS
jgi:hypothetical protein